MADSKKASNKETKTTAGGDKKSTIAEKAPIVDLGFLEEDDDFDEFPAEDWKDNIENEEEQVNIWEDNWDDDNIEDDFSKQLKAELEKRNLSTSGIVLS